MKAIVLVLRGLHLGYVGCYGNSWIDTPGLDRLAAEGIVFDQHYADCPESAAARRAWRSGYWQLPALHPNTPEDDLLKLLSQSGVRTGLVLDLSHPLPPAFATGWDGVQRMAPCGEQKSAVDGILASVQLAMCELTKRDSWLLWIDLAILLPPWIALR